jgi:hypothetical protein
MHSVLPGKPLLIILFVFISYSAKAQQWTWYQSNSGLISNNVRSLSISKSGRLYAGTLSGLSLFQNNSWQTVPVGNISSPSIYNVWHTGDSLWLGTEYNGLWGFTNNVWKNYDPNTSGNGIVGFGKDSRDSIYRLDKFGDFDRWTGTGWNQILNFVSQPNKLFIDRSDNVWILSNNAGLKKYKSGTFTNWQGMLYNPNTPTLLPSGSLHDMVQDSTGILWIASNDGLIRFDGTNFQLYNTQNSGIASNKTRCLAFDHQGNLWIGTWDQGLSKWNGTTWQTINTLNSPLTSPIINDIVVDSFNRIWIANGYNEFISPSGGQGIFVLDGSVDLSNGQLPLAPKDLSARVISVNEVILNWKDTSDNETGFMLERSDGNSNNFQQIKFLSYNTQKYTDLTVNGNTIYYYRIRSTNSQGNSAYSNTIQVKPKYCTVNKASYSAYAIATKVVFGSINKQSFNCTNGYYDYMDEKTQLFAGQTVWLTVAFDRCSVTSDPIIGGTVYVDWNSDGDFDDNGERIFNNTNINGKGEYHVAVTVPDFVIPGTISRLRVRSEDDVYPTTTSVPPCGFAEETQDYTIEFISNPGTRKPNPVTTANISSKVQWVEWQDNSYGETGFSIERSPDSISFTRIAAVGPNKIQYRDSLLQPDTKYYYRIVALFTSDSVISNIILSKTYSADLIRQFQGNITTDRTFNVGSYWDDYNNDGNLDLFAPGANSLYVNQDGILNRSSNSFINGASASWGDINNDGFDDLFVGDYIYGGGSSSTALYVNAGNGTFSKTIPITPDGRINNTVWTDYNKDGYLDLYISYLDLGYGKLYRNNKNGTFSFAIKFDNSPGFASFADYDNDGDDDLVVMGAGFPAIFNRNDTTFTRNNTSNILQLTETSRGVSWADFDNDGDLDIFVPNSLSNSFSKLYINTGSGNFIRNFGVFVNLNGDAMGSAWTDFDNDGIQDLFVTRFQKPVKLFRNTLSSLQELPQSIFLEEDYSTFPYESLPAMGCSWGDYNNDGFPDLYVAVNNGFESRLYKNSGNQNHWIKLNLSGVQSNRNAIGAKIKIKSNGIWQYRWVQSGTGFAAQNSFQLNFGLGSNKLIDSITIQWPSGIYQVLKNIQSDQLISIIETSTPTAINDPVAEPVDIYPNPAKDVVYLKLKNNELIKQKMASMYNANGLETKHQLKYIGNNIYRIDIKGISNGVYWLEIKEKTFAIRKEIILLR